MIVTLSNNRGWILIDCLVAVLILSVALTGLGMAFSQATTGVTAADSRTKAAFYAKQLLAQQRTYELKGIIGTAQWSSVPAYLSLPIYPLSGQVVDQSTNITYYYTIAATTGPTGLASQVTGSEPTLIPVMITMSWPQANGPNTLAVYTYYRQ